MNIVAAADLHQKADANCRERSAAQVIGNCRYSGKGVTKVRANSQRERFLDSLPRHNVDPTTRLEAVVKAVHTCFVENDCELSPGDLSFEIAREAILELLRITAEVNAAKLWEEVWDLPSGFCIDSLPEPFQTSRKRKLARMQALLRSKTITSKSLVRSMEIIRDSITSMRMEFSVALIPDGDLDPSLKESKRYKCAAVLGAVSNLLDRYWSPIRDQMPYEWYRRTDDDDDD